MASTALPRPLLSLLRAGVLLSLTATAAVAQTEYPHAAGTDRSGRVQAVSDAAGRVLIESPEFPRGLWVGLVDEGGKALAGIQVAYEGWPDSLVAVHCVDPSGLRQETLLWTRPGGDPLRLVLKPDEPTDLPAGLASIDWRIGPGAEELPVLEEGPDLIGWEAVTAFLQERWQDRTGRVAVQIESSIALAVDLADAEPVVRLVDYLEDRARSSLGEEIASLVQVLLVPRPFDRKSARLEDSILLNMSFIVIPGSLLEEWLLMDLGGSGPVTRSRATSLKRLDLPELQIVDLSPLALLTGLEELRLSDNQIVDLGPLSALTNLESLDLVSNQIVDLSPLSALTNLESMFLDYNQIVDLSPLSALASLERLRLSFNGIVDLSPLSSLTSLESLDLVYNQIVDLSPLSALTNLEALYVEDNGIVDLSPLSSLTNLELLYLEDNGIVDLSPLSVLTSLESMYLDGNGIVDLSPLSALTSLESLDLDGNEIADVSPLAALTNLRTLSLAANEIEDLSPLVSLTSLESLDLSCNWIEDFGPLLNNIGLGEGDVVYLQGDQVRYGPQEILDQISALKARGVRVHFEDPVEGYILVGPYCDE